MVLRRSDLGPGLAFRVLGFIVSGLEFLERSKANPMIAIVWRLWLMLATTEYYSFGRIVVGLEKPKLMKPAAKNLDRTRCHNNKPTEGVAHLGQSAFGLTLVCKQRLPTM